jgi:GcrA cell cycle regulator
VATPWNKLIWTDEEKAILAKMWADGASSAEIGSVLGKNRNAIIGQAHRLGLPKHQHTSRRSLKDTPRKPKEAYVKSSTPLPPRVVAPLIITSSGVSFMDAKDSQCHAIIGRDEKTDSFLSGLVRYCGNPVKEGSWACEGHYHQYYTPPRYRL